MADQSKLSAKKHTNKIYNIPKIWKKIDKIIFGVCDIFSFKKQFSSKNDNT